MLCIFAGGSTAVQLVTPPPAEAQSYALLPTTSMLLPHVVERAVPSPPPAPRPALAPMRNDSNTRPAVLPAMYVSFAVLQGLDAHSTQSALARGYTESNPLMRPASRDMRVMVAIKAAATVGTILVVENLWKRNRVAAILTMIGVNAGYGLVVGGNYRRARAAP